MEHDFSESSSAVRRQRQVGINELEDSLAYKEISGPAETNKQNKTKFKKPTNKQKLKKRKVMVVVTDKW